ncbi:MAG TPA: folylpolyglutamate synthase/dihydrofolate synthase family protein [Ignavibacteria bacterium]|nr:folylpolyglutamate synthase/dihydrofolate synthase family protein [Ignavibacteria bacterium]HMR39446.1 folylpolyglutamate synthase/dihydrofolate synthase family protein [Ignavibacteria bacterium]
MPLKKFKDYNKCISYLFNLERAGIKYDLNNITSLLNYLGNPQDKYPTIHIAGTNGKGSVSSIINSVLTESGCKCGLYTSPHITDFRERILINGKFISKDFIINTVNKLYREIQKTGPSFFEVTTAIAFDYFRYMNVDVAVIETGLGGRLDSTNIINPVLSVITAISIDHTEMLGKTVEKITMEKGGIIKNNIPVVVGHIPLKSGKILKAIADTKNSEITFIRNGKGFRILNRNEKGFFFTEEGFKKRYFFPAPGDYQLKNISVSAKALSVFGKSCNLKISKNAFFKGLQNIKNNSGLKGRFEKISESPKIVSDISHNHQGILNIQSNLKYFTYDKLYIIFSMMKDKHYKECIREIGKLDAEIILTKTQYSRAATPEELYSTVMRYKKKFRIKKNVFESLEYVNGQAEKKDLVLITGSFFLVSEALEQLKKIDKTKKHINNKS